MTILRLLAVLSLIASQYGLAASFDCKRAVTSIEKAICNDNELSALDEKLADTYKNLKSRFPEFVQSNLKLTQKEWLKTRDRLCSAAKMGCLKYQYTYRIERLNSYLNFNLYGLSFDGSDKVIEIEKLIAIFARPDGESYPKFIMYPKTKISILKQLMHQPFNIGFSPYNTFERPLEFEKDGDEIQIISCSDYISAQEQGYGLSIKVGPYRAVINYLQGCREADYLIKSMPTVR